MPIVLASHNPGKLAEFQQLFAMEYAPNNSYICYEDRGAQDSAPRSQEQFPLNSRCRRYFVNIPKLQPIIPLSQFSQQEANETGVTFIENALIKARHACTLSHLPALADDSGLCIPALENQPGIHSARFAGKGASVDQNNTKLLQILKNAQLVDCPACFYCILVFMQTATDPMPLIAYGRWEGIIVDQPRGSDGFGYDPIFYIPALGKTAAELTMAEKNQYSHRALAMRQLRKLLA